MYLNALLYAKKIVESAEEIVTNIGPQCQKPWFIYKNRNIYTDEFC